MTAPAPDRTAGIYRHMLRGSAYMLIMRWCTRLLGAISTVILARLLTPEDFGLIAMAMVAVNLVQTFTDLGATMFVIRERDADEDLFNTAWTVNVITGVVVGLILYLVAPYAAVYFKETRVVSIIHVAVVAFMITNLQNMGPIRALKELQFEREFRFNMYQKLGQFFVTIGLAYWLKSYWALTLGSLAGAVWGCLLSYWLFAHWPRLSLRRGPAVLKFAGAIIPGSVAGFFNQKIDILLLSNLYGPSPVGLYNIAKEFSNVIVNEIPLAANRALLPSYAAISHDIEQLKSAYLQSFRALAILYVAFGVGLYAIAENFVPLVLGEKWVGSIAFLQWLSLCAVVGALLGQISGSILVVVKKEWLLAGLRWLRVVFSVAAVFAAVRLGGIDAVPQGLLAAYCGLLPIFVGVIMRVLGLTVGQILSALFAPAIAALLMVWSIHALPISGVFPPVAMAIDIVLGALVYILALTAVWMARGRPPGPEKFIVGAVMARLSK